MASAAARPRLVGQLWFQAPAGTCALDRDVLAATLPPKPPALAPA
jgi:hypothetical protein